jgi:hypothetical protein
VTLFLGVGAVDIDGTLMEHDGKPDYLDPLSLEKAKAHWPTCVRIRTLIEAGFDVHFITGRTGAVRDVTLRQIRTFVHPSISPSRLHMNGRFTGYDDLAAWKAKKLQEIGSEWYVGDHEADKVAATMAGVPFQFAQAYQDASAEAPWAVV